MSLLDDIRPVDAPLARGHGRGLPSQIQGIADTMRTHPGQWYVYAEAANANSASTFAARLRRIYPGAETRSAWNAERGVQECYGRCPEEGSS